MKPQRVLIVGSHAGFTTATSLLLKDKALIIDIEAEGVARKEVSQYYNSSSLPKQASHREPKPTKVKPYYRRNRF